MAQDIVVAETSSVLTAARIESGAAYLASLQDLGFEPDVLCWVYLGPEGEFELALVTSLVDRIGSKAIYDVLFMAYDSEVTPREVHPLLISVYSPQMDMGRDLIRGLTSPKVEDGMIWVGIGVPKLVPRSGVYAAREPRLSREADMQRWRRFERRVRSLAA